MIGAGQSRAIEAVPLPRASARRFMPAPPKVTVPLEDVFRALADPTRRRVMERLARGAASVGELAEPFDMALPSFLQHLRVLEAAGLVLSEKQGRVRTYRIDGRPLRQAEDWLGRQRAVWERRLDQLDEYLLKLKDQQP